MTDPPCDDAVLMVCTNDKCIINQNLHKRCFDNFEAVLIRTIQSSMGRTRDWTDDQCRKAMWGRVYDMIYRNSKCVCGGHLKKHENAEIVGVLDGQSKNKTSADVETKKKKNKAGRKDLPKLIQLEKNKVDPPASTSAIAKSLPNVYQPPTAFSSSYGSKFDSKMNQFVPETYIPGLVLTADDKPNNKKNAEKICPKPKISVESKNDVIHDVQRSDGDVDRNRCSSISFELSAIADYAKISLDRAFVYADIESALNELVAKFSSSEIKNLPNNVKNTTFNGTNQFDSRFFPKNGEILNKKVENARNPRFV